MTEFWGFVVIALIVALPIGAVIAGLLFILGSIGEGVAGIHAAHDKRKRRK